MTSSPRRPSPLQRSILILLAGLAERGTARVRTRDLEHLLGSAADRAVYGNNLRASCRRMEDAGWLRTLRAPNLQLAVELTDAGGEMAAPLLAAEQARVQAERRATAVVVLPLSSRSPQPEAPEDRPVPLDDVWHLACRADFVMRLDGTTCLQLWSSAGQRIRLEGDAVQVASWLQACHDAGIPVRMQINESTTPEEGEMAAPPPADQTDTWYRQLDSALQALGISGLTDEERRAVVTPGEALRPLPAPARLLHILRESLAAFPLTAASCEEDTGTALDTLLARAGFTAEQTKELRTHRIRWPLMDKDELERREQSDLIALLDALEQRQLFCHRERLITLIFSPVRKPGESWTERLRWLLGDGMADGFGFRSTLSRKDDRALDYLAGWLGQEDADRLCASVQWASSL